MFWLFSWILGSLLDSNPLDCFLQGFIGACGITVLCNLMRVHHFRQMSSSDNSSETDIKRKSSLLVSGLGGQWKTGLWFWFLTLLLSLVGSRVSSLIVLEFILRALSAWATTESHDASLDLLLVQCQFSLGCGLTCILGFIHQGAPHSSLSLVLAAALSWALASFCHSLWRHVAKLYPLHSTERYCGKCITLLTSGHAILTSLRKVLVLAFALAAVASFATVYVHFMSQKDALKFWTPLTLCYTMLVVYIQEQQHQQTGSEALLHAVVVRLGAILVLMLTVGEWSDVLHAFIAFVGEAACLVPSQDLLDVVQKEEETGNLMTKYEQSPKSNPTRKISSDDSPSGTMTSSRVKK